MSVVYGLADPDTLDIRYVGQSIKTAEFRLGQRVWMAEHGGKYYVHNWIRSLKSYPKLIILEENPEDLDETESYWIAFYRNSGVKLTNCSDGGFSLRGYIPTEEHKRKIGESRRGKRHTLESKAKMSLARIGNKNSLGYVPTEEERRKISEANKGHIPTEETRKKLSLAGLGRKHSPETIAKIRAANIGHTVSPEQKAKFAETIRIRQISSGKKAV